jgi:hypothetical protein
MKIFESEEQKPMWHFNRYQVETEWAIIINYLLISKKERRG